MKVIAAVVFVIVVFLSGLFVGWKLHAGKSDHKALATSHHQLQDLHKRASDQIERRAKDEKHQQQLSSDLMDHQHTIDQQGEHLQETIDHAQFQIPPAPHVHAAADRARPDPVGTAEFVRLYNEAARGGAPAAAASAQGEAR